MYRKPVSVVDDVQLTHNVFSPPILPTAMVIDEGLGPISMQLVAQRIAMAFSMKFLASVHSSSPPKRPTPAHTMFLPCFREVLLNFHTTTSQIMKNHKKGMTMAHVLQQGLWGEGVLHSEHL